MRKANKKIVSMVAVAAIAATMCMGVVSYFTDYSSKELQARAGTLNMSMTAATEDLTNGVTILNPGDKNPLEFTANNTGEKSMDVKAVITVTSDKAMTDKHEYRVETAEGTELAGAALSEDSKVLTYTVDGTVLNGSIETENDVTVKTHAYAYKFVMDEGCKNEWQNTNVTVKVELFAKQHRNTTAGWQLIDSFETVND